MNKLHRRAMLGAATAVLATASSLSLSDEALACHRTTCKPWRRKPAPPPPAPEPTPSDAKPYGGLYYGCAYAAGDLGNTPFQTYHAHRFVCERGGHVAKVRWLSPRRSGYYAGNGGNLIVHICEDAGGVPNLSRKVGSTPLQTAAYGLGDAPLVSFQTPVPLTFGQTYHIVWEQVAVSRGWLSIDDLWSFAPTTPRSAYPLQGNALASLMHIPSTDEFRLRPEQVPIHELHYSDGVVKGQGYTFGCNTEKRLIDGGRQVRQVFTVPMAASFDSLQLWLWRLGSGSGDLSVVLKDVASGARLATALVPRSDVTVSCQDRGCSTPVSWVNVSFDKVAALQAGQKVACVLTAPEGAQYVACPNWKNFWNGFSADSMWRNARAEFSTNSGSSWTGWSLWGQSNRSDIDMPMLFRVI